VRGGGVIESHMDTVQRQGCLKFPGNVIKVWAPHPLGALIDHSSSG